MKPLRFGAILILTTASIATVACSQRRSAAVHALASAASPLVAAPEDDSGGESPGPATFVGRIRAIVIRPDDPNTIWVAAATGGLWVSHNGGSDWSQADDFLPSLTFSSLTIDPGNPNVMYAGTGEIYSFLFHLDRLQTTIENVEGLILRSPYRGAGIVKTTDGGTTWRLLGATANNPDFHYVNRIAISPSGSSLVLAATSTGLWRSEDAGASWAKVIGPELDGAIALDVKFHPVAPPSAVVATHDRGIFHTRQASALSWLRSTLPADLPTAPDHGTRIELAPSRSEPGVWLAAYFLENGSNTQFHLLRSADRGESFQHLNDQPGPVMLASGPMKNNRLYTGALWVDPQRSNNIVLGGGGLARSIDGGITFSKIGTGLHDDYHVIVGDGLPDSRRIYLGNDGGVARIDNYDDSAEAVSLNTGLDARQFHGAMKNPSSGIIIGGTQDTGTFRRDTAGVWTGILGEGAGGDDAMMVATDPSDPDVWYYGTSQGRVSRSTDGGNTDQQIFECSSTHRLEGPCIGNTPMLLDPSNANQLYIGCSRLWRTKQAKATDCATIEWRSIKPASSVDDKTHLITTMAIAAYDPNVMWVGTLANLGPGIGPTDPHAREIWMTTQLQTLPDDASLDGWTRVSDGSPLPQRPVARISLHPTDQCRVYVSFSGWASEGSHNLWKGTKRDDGSFEWSDVSAGLPAGPVFSTTVHPAGGWIYAGTNAGLHRSADDGQTWSIVPDGRVPRVPISDLSWAGDHELIVATYGRGVFLLDENRNPEQVYPEIVSHAKGRFSDGHVEELSLSDGRTLRSTGKDGFVVMEIAGRSGFARTAPIGPGANLKFQIESSARPAGPLAPMIVGIELFNFSKAKYELAFAGALSPGEHLVTTPPARPVRDFVSDSRELRARVTWDRISSSSVDLARWVIRR